jgi:hypothetical protein
MSSYGNVKLRYGLGQAEQLISGQPMEQLESYVNFTVPG